MELLDSRRLTGPNLLQDGPGAVLEVAFAMGEAETEAERAVAAWKEEARRLLDAVGWGGKRLVVRRYPGGASLALSAPFDALYSATEVAEQAWSAAAARLAGAQESRRDEGAAERLAAAIAAEEKPALRELAAAAAHRGVAFLWDDERASVGTGTGSLTWEVAALPAPAEIPWEEVHDVPVLLVTGTNGKTTTVRLLAAMATAAGRMAGTTSTDAIVVGDEVLDLGDYSGPGGARTLLRDRRVELAVLETARGGLLRRGLAVTSAAAAAVTNVAADHLGEFGISDLGALAEVKLLVGRVIVPEGRIVLNADDTQLAARGEAHRSNGSFRAPLLWFGLDPEAPRLRSHLAAGGEAALLEGETLVLRRGGERQEVARVADVPLAFGGAARYNLANALAAIGLAAAAGLPLAAMAAGLARFGHAPQENPGRALLRERDGVKILLDYAHNPHGLAALIGLAGTLPAARRLILLGQAGDRDDEAIRDLARTAWSFRPDRVVIKELTTMLRGRQPGEVPALLEAELRRLGAPEEALVHAPDEPAAVRQALAWARPGDLLVLPVHTHREEVMEMLAGATGSAGPQDGRLNSEPPR